MYEALCTGDDIDCNQTARLTEPFAAAQQFAADHCASDQRIFGKQDLARLRFAKLPSQNGRLTVGPTSSLKSEQRSSIASPPQLANPFAGHLFADYAIAIRPRDDKPGGADQPIRLARLEPRRNPRAITGIGAGSIRQALWRCAREQARFLRTRDPHFAIRQRHVAIVRFELSGRNWPIGELRRETLVEQKSFGRFACDSLCLDAYPGTRRDYQCSSVVRPCETIDIIGKGGRLSRWYRSVRIDQPYLGRTVQPLEIADLGTVRRPAGRIGPVPSAHNRGEVAQSEIIADEFAAPVDLDGGTASVHRRNHEPLAVYVGFRICAFYEESDVLAVGRYAEGPGSAERIGASDVSHPDLIIERKSPLATAR